MNRSHRTFQLGQNTLNRIGLGTNRLTDTEENRSFIRAAVDAGLDFIDTAHLYTKGSSESTIGAALAPFPDEVVVATKGGYRSNDPEELRAEIELSFERLRTDTIDLWYLHRVHPDDPFEETLGLVSEYVTAGRITQVGVSEVSVEEIAVAQSIVSVAAVQNEYSLVERKHDEVIDHCEAERIAFVPFFPLAGDPTPAVREAAGRHEASANQIKLAWLLHRSPCVVPIPGTLSLEHLRDNLAALEIELDPEEQRSLTNG